MLVSEGQEIAMGKGADPQIVAQMGVVQDEELQRYVAQLGRAIAQASERPNLPWTFRVIEDPVVNAFAVPGGFIYVTRGILAHLNSEAELVAVLGHEVGHVTARHSAAQMSKQQVAGLGIVLGAVLKPELAQYAEAASQGLGLLFLKFGRDDERQADDLGLRYTRRTGYDARQMPRVYELLGRVSEASGSSGRVPSWLSTHPDPGDRRERIERALAAIPPESAGREIKRVEYLRHIDGLVYGMNPRLGFFRGSQFFHPDLQFKLAFPDGWKTSNMSQAVVAMSPQQDAIIQLQLEAQGTSLESAARAFFNQQGVQGVPRNLRINELPATGGEFAAQTQDGILRGIAAFVSYGGAVYRLMGYTPQQRWPAYRGIIESSVLSFDRLTDPAMLRVQPQHVRVVTLPRAMSLAEFAAAYPGPVSVKELALLNNVDETARFEAGARVKRVVGEQLPKS
jgi:predicted Zn-dependent protease